VAQLVDLTTIAEKPQNCRRTPGHALNTAARGFRPATALCQRGRRQPLLPAPARL